MIVQREARHAWNAFSWEAGCAYAATLLAANVGLYDEAASAADTQEWCEDVYRHFRPGQGF